ncbi:MAG: TrpR-related protein YerC/YecD [Firmicutes bacterium]|nr:TrpR-related protein YerC/YecD [Candidatus Caballimonas caccae]
MSEDMKGETKDLFNTIAEITDAKVIRELFEDLCTYKEIDAMAQRLYAAKLLKEGKTYEQVIEKTDISSATLSRVSKCLKFGEGYKKVLK